MEELKITEVMKANLLSSVKWLKFLTVVTCVAIGVLVLAAVVCILAPDTFSEEFPGGLLGFAYLFGAALYVYPVIKSFGVIRNTRSAFASNCQEDIENATADCLSVLRYLGILTIVALVFYALLFFFVIFAAFCMMQ